MKIIRYPQKEEWNSIVERPHLDVSQLNATVESVLKDVRENGDKAVMAYEEKFDHAQL
jgi:histidinol dehydrogenase